MNVELKTCHVDPRHTWIADLDYCPYCNHTPQERADAMNKPTRRAPTHKERITPCECCGYPISHRHHLLPVNEFGENNITVQLCPNCHDLFHVAYNTHLIPISEKEEVANGKKRARKSLLAWGTFVLRGGEHKKTIRYIQELVDQAFALRRSVFENILGDDNE